MTKSQKKELKKILIAAVFMIAGIVMEQYAEGRFAGGDALTGKWSFYLEVALFLAAYLMAGLEVVKKAFGGLFRGALLDENFLMAVASIGAFILGEFTEGVAVMLFYCVGELFEDYAVNRSRTSIAELMDIRPDYANLYNRETETAEVCDPYDVKVGDYIQIKPGEKVPLDGKVVGGGSTVQTAAITGESIPRDVSEGDEVLSGYVNMTGVLILEVTKEFDESTASKILELVENAAASKARTERFVTKFARVYTPAVVGAAALLAVVPPLILQQSFSVWVYRALLFLVVSCPCALVISVPLSFFGGIGAASKAGILVKGSNFLEAVAGADTMVFDKTGTLTTGQFKVLEVIPAGAALYTKEEILRLAAHAECFSPHPIAKSIREAYGKEVAQSLVSEVEDAAGFGISALVQEAAGSGAGSESARTDAAESEKPAGAGRRVLAGNLRFMKKQGDKIGKAAEDALAKAEKGGAAGTMVFVAVDGEFAGIIIIGDEVKPDTAKTVAGLAKAGVSRIAMLTGDRAPAAKKLAAAVGIREENVFAELLPGDKLSKVQELIAGRTNRKGKLAYVGDGINDAPVLAGADVGIAMGALGSDAAISAADVVLMTDEPSKVLTLISIAKKTVKICRENIVFALGVKFIIMILGALGLAGMWAAVFADVGVAVLAILNSMRALRVDKVN